MAPTRCIDGNAVCTPGLSERRGSASKFYHSDALGSTRGITDSTQSVTDSQLYDAFGNTVSRTGTTPTPFGFVGKAQYQSDSDSGLQLLGHRYYDPSIGRFLSQDPIQDGDNWYAYCDNNPLNDIDAEGLLKQKKSGKQKAGLIVGILGGLLGNFGLGPSVPGFNAPSVPTPEQVTEVTAPDQREKKKPGAGGGPKPKPIQIPSLPWWLLPVAIHPNPGLIKGIGSAIGNAGRIIRGGAGIIGNGLQELASPVFIVPIDKNGNMPGMPGFGRNTDT